MSGDDPGWMSSVLANNPGDLLAFHPPNRELSSVENRSGAKEDDSGAARWWASESRESCPFSKSQVAGYGCKLIRMVTPAVHGITMHGTHRTGQGSYLSK